MKKEKKIEAKEKKIEWFDDLIYDALRKRKKVELFLCRDVEGGFGIKIDGKVVGRNFVWETFEFEND